MGADVYIRRLSEIKFESSANDYRDDFGLCDIPESKKMTLMANPNALNDYIPVQMVGRVGNKIVGQELVFPVYIKVAEKRLLAFSGSGLFVHEKFRSSMLGLDLIAKRETLSSDGLALGCGLSQMALPAHLMLDYLAFSMPRYLWIFRSRVVVEKWLGQSFFSAIVSFLLDGALCLRTALLRIYNCWRLRGFIVEEVFEVDESVVKLIQQDEHQFSCEQSAKGLSWLLNYSFTNDVRSSQKCFLVKSRDGNPLGFFMFKVRFHETASQRGYKNLLLGSLVEWQTADPRKVSHATLALFAIQKMHESGVDAVEVCTDEQRMSSVLRRWAMQHKGDLSFVLRATESSPLRDYAGWDSHKNWRLRPAYGDNGLS